MKFLCTWAAACCFLFILSLNIWLFNVLITSYPGNVSFFIYQCFFLFILSLQLSWNFVIQLKSLKKREIKFNRFKMFYPLFLQIYCRRTQERFTQLLVYSEVKLSLLILPFYFLHAVQISNLRTRYALSILLDDFRNIWLGNTIIIFITKQIGWT